MSTDVARLFYTPEMDEFLMEFVPGHSKAEITDEFERRFGIRLRRSQLKNRMTTLGVRQGINTGQFKKGQPAYNKGMKQTDFMSAEGIERTKATRFQKGQIPHNAIGFGIGRERVDKDGYVLVKVKLHSNAEGRWNNYRYKHVLIWEQEHGCHIPPKTAIIFADGNKRNFDPNNLVAVPRRVLMIINRHHIPYFDRTSLEAAMKIAEIKMKANELELSIPRTCKECGAQFKPEFKNQIRCRSCINERKSK
jgi:predicted Zn-ribbon and HTH transcriptional regulator